MASRIVKGLLCAIAGIGVRLSTVNGGLPAAAGSRMESVTRTDPNPDWCDARGSTMMQCGERKLETATFSMA